MTDWDSIRETNGFRIGDQVRCRGQDLGIIQHLIDARGTLRAHIHWPTIPFECEGQVSSGSESFVDLGELERQAQRSGEQLGLFEAHTTNSEVQR